MPGILVVDDYAVARTTITELLRWRELQVCGEAHNGKDAIEKVKQLRPDVVLLDINMPRISPRTKILFLTVIGPEEASASARLLGDGYIPKSNAGTELIPALERLLGRPNAN